MPSPHRIGGYAIVTEGGMLADAGRVMPASLKFEADQNFFERGLDGVDVVWCMGATLMSGSRIRICGAD
jgi:hypothetical protein